MDNYKQVLEKLENMTPFSGNTMRGYWHESLEGRQCYYVYSYTTLIAEQEGDYDSQHRWISPEKYSVTTSRHQNIVRKAWGF